MSRNEDRTCRELIEPALKKAGWEWDREVVIGPGRVNLTGESMYDSSQRIIADYVLRLSQMPVAILEAKAPGKVCDGTGMQQGSRYADRLVLDFRLPQTGASISSPTTRPVSSRHFDTPPTPGDILSRLGQHRLARSGTRRSRPPWYRGPDYPEEGASLSRDGHL